MEELAPGLTDTASADDSMGSMRIQFSLPGARRWLTIAPKTRWRWTGRAELKFDGNDTVLRGRRARAFMPSAAQEIRFPSNDVLDVVTTGAAIRCQVKQPNGKPEPLSFRTENAQMAQAIAARWPRDHSVAFRERTAFDQALLAVSGRLMVTPGLIVLNVLMFALMVIFGINIMLPSGADLIPWGSNYGPQTLNGQWWRLLVSMFLHFGLLHLLFNMWALASFGPLAERLFGRARFLLLYVFAGLCGSIASLLWNPSVNSAGASGAIFGVLGGLVAFVVNPKTKIPASVSTAQRNSGLVFVAYNLLNGMSHAGIDNACHIGGLVGGFAMGWLLARPLESEARTEEASGLTVALCAAAVTLLALSWPLTHPSQQTVVKRQFRQSLIPFATAESKALKLAAELNQNKSRGTLTDNQYAQRMLDEVVPLWQEAGDDVSNLDFPPGANFDALKTAMLTYIDSRRLAVELTAEAVSEHSADKQAWATKVLQSSNAQAQVASALLNKAL